MEFLASIFKQSIQLKWKTNAYSKKCWHLCLAQTKRLKQKIARCDLCHNPSIDGGFLCSTCQHDCARFILPNSANNLLLWPAIDKVFHKRKFDQLLCYAPYTWPYDAWLKQFKYQARFELASLFSQLLLSCWLDYLKKTAGTNNHTNTCVISVPLHIKKWQTRGFNQAHLIANNFAQRSSLPYLNNLLSRNKKGDSQVGQSGAQRRKNLANAFVINEKIPKHFRHIIIVDDVITTGTTVNEISRLLKKQGVESVTVMTIALSLPTH
ncbi:MAG: ComF family protein [Thalassotalea sp.]|mgnify:CR=1 FL=1